MAYPNGCEKQGNEFCGLCCTKVEHFGVKFGSKEILHDVNLHIHCGELTAVIGPNGAGKSTLLKAILGELKHSGNLNYLDAADQNTGVPVIGYVPQHLDFDLSSPLSVMDLFAAGNSRLPAFAAHSRSLRQKAMESLSRVQAEHLHDQRLGNLSGGELQRVLLALALTPIPDLLLLDEPVSGVDQPGMELFYEMVSDLRRRYDLSIILVSHDLPLMARFADRIVYLDQTVKSSGTPAQVFNDPYVTGVFGRIAVPALPKGQIIDLKDGV